MSFQRTRAADCGFDTTSRSPPRKTERTVTFEILQAAILSMIEDINLAIGADDDGDDAGDQVERWKLYDTLPIKDQIAAAKTRFNFIDAELVGLKSRIVDGRMFLYDDVEWVVTQRRSDIRGSLLATSGQMPTALAGRTFHEVRERLHEIIDHLAASLPAYSAVTHSRCLFVAIPTRHAPGVFQSKRTYHRRVTQRGVLMDGAVDPAWVSQVLWVLEPLAHLCPGVERRTQ